MPVKTRPAQPTAAQLTENPIRELIRVFGLMERINQSYFARFGISGAQWGVLRNLHRAEQEGLPGLRLTDLGERLLIRPPSVTGVVDRLERAGLVSRDSAPEDLRAKLVVLTTAGRAVIDRVLEGHDERIGTLLGGLSSAEQATLHRLLGKLGSHLTNLLHGHRARAQSNGKHSGNGARN